MTTIKKELGIECCYKLFFLEVEDTRVLIYTEFDYDVYKHKERGPAVTHS